MATTYSTVPAAQRGAGFPPPSAQKPQPAGTFLPGTKVQVGSQRVVIEKYLSEGGFAHVYVVRIPKENHKHELAVLKRVAVPDKEHLANMRTEVETMKKLKGHKHVVTYMDSHASQLKGGGYEVFLLMEYCSGGGLIDFMNTRLQHRLTEPEILKIFGDVAEGVACMHYLKPPLLHRDLKVENVLIAKSASSGAPTYKVCDFGSSAPPRPAARTAEEGRLIEEDVQKHTTMQYRSPEMIDVWRKQPIDEKADIWALGVLLYKLCYYTTPFEDVGQMAILNASFKFPSYPAFSDRLKKLISWMLKEDPKQRPNIYQLIKEVCSMRGTEVPIRDIYTERTPSEVRRNESLPTPEAAGRSTAVGLQKVAPQVQVQSIPDIAPMRRGRPTAQAQATPIAAKPSPSPARGDPFAALDSKSYEVRAGAVDELSKRFPSLDEFSITHEKGGRFAFTDIGPAAPQVVSGQKGNLSERVTNALADELFAQSQPKPETSATLPKTVKSAETQAARAPASGRVRDTVQESPLVHQPTPLRPGITYTSTGTGSSPPPPPKPSKLEANHRPIWRVPDHHRSASQPRASETAQAAATSLHPGLAQAQRPTFLDLHRSKSQTATVSAMRSPTSSRPSLEGHRPSQLDISDASESRAKSAQSRQRPSSVYVSSNLDFLRDHETSHKRSSLELNRHHSRHESQERNGKLADEAPIDSDMDFLRANEESDVSRKRSHHRKTSSGHKKRSSLPQIANAKAIFSGRFSDAFKRFEKNSSEEEAQALDRDTVTPEPQEDESIPRVLSPILGSEATPSKHSDDLDSAVEETEDLPPDVRRELERRRLSQEERRVAEAAAEYRARVAAQGTGGSVGPTRAITIQKRVQSLLEEGRQSPTIKRTAEGYGKYTDQPSASEAGTQSLSRSETAPAKAAPPPLARKPAIPEPSLNPYTKPLHQAATGPPPPTVPPPSSSAAPTQQGVQPQQRVVSRPSVPPKSQALRTGQRTSQRPPAQSATETDRPFPPKPSGGLAALLAKDMEGVPEYPPRGSSMAASSSTPAATIAVGSRSDGVFGSPDEELEADFSKRYPSLAGLEMVETEIGGETRPLRIREV